MAGIVWPLASVLDPDRIRWPCTLLLLFIAASMIPNVLTFEYIVQAALVAEIVSLFNLNPLVPLAQTSQGELCVRADLIPARMKADQTGTLRRPSFHHSLGRAPALSPLLVFRSVGMIRRSSTTIEHCLRSPKYSSPSQISLFRSKSRGRKQMHRQEKCHHGQIQCPEMPRNYVHASSGNVSVDEWAMLYFILHIAGWRTK